MAILGECAALGDRAFANRQLGCPELQLGPRPVSRSVFGSLSDFDAFAVLCRPKRPDPLPAAVESWPDSRIDRHDRARRRLARQCRNESCRASERQPGHSPRPQQSHPAQVESPVQELRDMLSSNWQENSNYNGLQVGLEERFSAALSFLIGYNWSHSIDTVYPCPGPRELAAASGLSG